MKNKRLHQSVLARLRFQFTSKDNQVYICVSIPNALCQIQYVFMSLHQNVQKGGLVLAALITVTVMVQCVILLREAVTVQLAGQENIVRNVSNNGLLLRNMCKPQCWLWTT